MKILGDIGRRHQSYHGIQIALDAFWEHILTLQPSYLYLRMLIPLIMIQLGKDDEAYNFIKFWIKITPIQGKVEIFLKGSLDSIPSPSPSVKIQIMREIMF